MTEAPEDFVRRVTTEVFGQKLDQTSIASAAKKLQKAMRLPNPPGTPSPDLPLRAPGLSYSLPLSPNPVTDLW